MDILPPAPDRTSNLLSTLERITDPFLWAPARCRRAEPLLSRGPTHSRSKLSYCDFSPRPIFAYLCRQVAQPAHEPKVNIIIIQKTYFSNPWLVPQWDQDALFGTQLRSHIYIYIHRRDVARCGRLPFSMGYSEKRRNTHVSGAFYFRSYMDINGYYLQTQTATPQWVQRFPII